MHQMQQQGLQELSVMMLVSDCPVLYKHRMQHQDRQQMGTTPSRRMLRQEQLRAVTLQQKLQLLLAVVLLLVLVVLCRCLSSQLVAAQMLE